MDNNSAFLNVKWNNFFNWSVIAPFILFLALIGLFISLFGAIFVGGFFSSFGNMNYDNLMTGGIIGGTVLVFFGVFAFAIASIIYTIWFFIASDTLFKLLGINRWVGNILNLIGLFVIPGLSFLILPIYFYIQVKDYWQARGIAYNWKAVAK